MTQLGMSARAFHRTAERPAMGGVGLRSVKLARTISDLEEPSASGDDSLTENLRWRVKGGVAQEGENPGDEA